MKFSREQTVSRSLELARIMRLNTPGSRRWTRAREELAGMNYALVHWSARRCCRRLGVPPQRWLDDVVSVVNEAYAAALDSWDPDGPAALSHHVFSIAWDRVRAWWEAESGFSDASRQRRIGARVARLQDQMSAEVGHQVTLEEAVAEHNARFAETTSMADQERAMQMLLQPALPVEGDWDFSSMDNESPEWLLSAGEDRERMLGHLMAVLEEAASEDAPVLLRAAFEDAHARWVQSCDRIRADRRKRTMPPEPVLPAKNDADWNKFAAAHLELMRSAARCIVLRVGLDDDGPGRTWKAVGELMEITDVEARRLWRAGAAALAVRFDRLALSATAASA